MPLGLGIGIGAPFGGNLTTRAMLVLGSETDGIAGSFVDMSMIIKDLVTPANSFSGNPNSKLTYSSPSTKWILGADGLYSSGTTLRTEYNTSGTPLGLRIEEARTNVVLHNRDLTNAAWTKTNATAAKTQTGIDGVANSASSLTATAGNATCLQAITLTSSARYQSTFIKRITGTGTIEMTMDNGTTWTAVTVTSSWAPVEIPTQTLANPTVGFRIVTSGDAIAIDMVMNENSGAFRSSPIATTTGSVTRNADTITLADTLFNLQDSAGTFYAKVRPLYVGATTKIALETDDGTANERIRLDVSTAQPTIFGTDGGATVINAGSGVSLSVGVTAKIAAAYELNNSACCANGTLGGTDTVCTMPTVSTLRIGSGASGTSYFNGHMEEFMYLPVRKSGAAMQALTA